MSPHYLVKSKTRFLDQSYIVSFQKWIALKSIGSCVYRNLNFGQAVSLKLLEITILYTDTPCQSFLTLIYHIICHVVLAFNRCLNKSVIQLAQMLCCLVVTGVYTRSLCEFFMIHSKQFLISERINFIFVFCEIKQYAIRHIYMLCIYDAA